MKRIVVIAALAGWAGALHAQSGASLYNPSRALTEQGISLKPWGSGTIADTDEVAFEGARSVRVSTRNLFQGGRMLFSKPVDLSASFSDKNNLLLLAVRVADQSLSLGASGGEGKASSPSAGGAGLGGGKGSSMAGGESSGGSRGGALGSQGGRGGSMGAQGDTGNQKGGPAAPQSLKRIRLVVTTTDGKRSEVEVPISGTANQRGWRRTGVPLQAIRGFDKTNMQIKEIAIAGDATSSFYIGEMSILNDATPLYGDTNVKDLNLPFAFEQEFIAYGSGGSSVLEYVWDFDESDGIQEDARGQFVKRKFRKPGNYVVTMTVIDAYGLKQPYSTKIKVTVNP